MDGRRIDVAGLLASRAAPPLLGVVAMVLAAPSLTTGWQMDDHFHRLKMIGPAQAVDASHGRLDLFRFLDGDPDRTRALIDRGRIPWWTFPGIRAAFWRPVTVFTHWLDYRLWPTSPALMHGQSLLWLGALVTAAGFMYRRLMGAVPVAGLATLLYAVDDARATTVGFLANRNALVAALFGVLAIILHDRWRRERWRGGALLAPLMLGVSLLSAEGGVATTAYLFAYALCLERGTWQAKLRSLWPYAAVVVVWRMLWVRLGYGVSGVGGYVDPLAEPLRFLHALIDRAPIYLLGQWAMPSADIAVMDNAVLTRWVWRGAVVFLAVAAVIVAPILRRQRVARFFTVGMLLSVVPICATICSDRLLVFVGIGAMGLCACVLSAAYRGAGCLSSDKATVPAAPAEEVGRRRGLRPLAGVLVAMHLVLAPVALLIRSTMPVGPPALNRRLHVRTPLDDAVARQSLVIVNAPSSFHANFLPVLRELAGRPVPRYTRILAPGYWGMTIHRPDTRTLVIRPERGYLDWMFDSLFRGPGHGFSLGDRVALTGMTASVISLTPDGRPATVAFAFAVLLEDESLRWLYWRDGEFVAFTPPAVGGTIELQRMRIGIW